MSATTSIEWTDRTWNPTTGCDKVSAGCKNCYAEVIAERFWAKQYPLVEIETGGPAGTVTRPRQFTDVRTHEDRLLEPLSWRKPSKVFVNSMSDLFHEDVPNEFIDKVFAVMARAPQHTFQILTKRHARMREYFHAIGGATRRDWVWVEVARQMNVSRLKGIDWPLPNVWLGVSVENQHFADERIPLLLQTPAAVRFISAEPLLGPIDFHSPVLEADSDGYLDWVIVGGESGPGARPFDLAWARSIVQQCKAAGVPVFVKQLGAQPYTTLPVLGEPVFTDLRLKDRKGGDPAEWPDDLRVREFPNGGQL